MSILISGIGRSGTTTLYEVIGKALLAKYPSGRCVYEPYLWDIPEIEKSAIAYGQPFDMEQVSLFNMLVHCNTPLFLEGRNLLHDQWLESIFGTSKEARHDVLAKVIRGMGRLNSYLTKYSNLKVIVSTRNPIDTVNSGLGIFSYFGDEFYRSDKRRFIEEVKNIFGEDLKYETERNEVDWSILWWKYFTDYSLKVYEKYPDRVLVVPYEQYVEDKRNVIEKILAFCNMDKRLPQDELLNKSAGTRTSVRYLNDSMIESMNGHMEWYFHRLKSHGLNDNSYEQFERKIKDKYSKRRFVESLLLKEKSTHTAVMWRILYKNKTEELSYKNSKNATQLYTLGEAVAEFGMNNEALRKSRVIKGLSREVYKKEYSLGVLVTSFNNINTISEAICSVIGQSKRPDLIYIADDCSNDGSQSLLKRLRSKFFDYNIVLKLRPANVGVAANRDLAIREMNVDFITTLDGDDLYLPGKLELEFNKICGNEYSVVFSDIARIDKEGSRILPTHIYANASKNKILETILSRNAQVPRDLMFSKKFYLEVEGFDVLLNIYEDWALKIRMATKCKDGNWKWSGGVGTVYNRIKPGLSGKPNIFHAHGQLVAISRNALLLKNHHNAILLGINTCMRFMNEAPRKRFAIMLQKYKNGQHTKQLVSNLDAFWKVAYHGDDASKRLKDIDELHI